MAEPREYRFRLEHMLETTQAIRTAVAGKSEAEYRQDWLLRSAIERGIEVISEASRHVPPEVKASAPEIDWRKIAGIGNVLRHEYNRVADDVVYQVATEDLAALETAVLRLLRRDG